MVDWKKGAFKNGIKNFLIALKVSENLGDKKAVAQICNDIGLIYQGQNNFTIALEFYNKSLKLRKEINDKRGLCQIYNNVGIVYESLKDNDKALNNYLKCLKASKEVKYFFWSCCC